jgi:hypothetical protein
MIGDEVEQIEYNDENNVLHFDREFQWQQFPIQRYFEEQTKMKRINYIEINKGWLLMKKLSYSTKITNINSSEKEKKLIGNKIM